MLKVQPDKNVPRAEYDHRAREARHRQERVERLLLADRVSRGARLVRLVRLVGLSVAGGGKREGGKTGSPNDHRTRDIMPAVSFPTCARGGGRPAAPRRRPQRIVCRAA